MAIARWPSTLPGVSVPLTGKVIDVVQRTEMEQGAQRVRARFTTAPKVFDAAWEFSVEQMRTFESWYRYYALNGAAWFYIPIYMALGTQDVLCRFEAPYSDRIASPSNFAVTASLYAPAFPVMTQEALQPYL